jgi:hypothetical protein
MRTDEQIAADAEDKSPFSNGTEYEMWAGRGRGCYDCLNDDPNTDKFCPILGVALLGKWPTEWTRRLYEWEIGDKKGAFPVVDECIEFDERRDDDGDDEPDPEPTPPPVIEGQIDMFEVFADRIADEASTRAVEVIAR